MFHQEGLAAVHIIPKGKHWYSIASINSVIKKVRRLRDQFKQCTVYGASMGGYASLLFAEKLAADTAVAICPQTTTDVKKTDDTRWLGIWKDLPFHPSIRIAEFTNATIIYDPFHHEDREHAARLSGQNISIVKVPCGCHQVLGLLKRMRIIRKTVIDLCTGNFDILDFRTSVRNSRRSTDEYRRGLLETVICSGKSNSDERGSSLVPFVLAASLRPNEVGRLSRLANRHRLKKTSAMLAVHIKACEAAAMSV